MTALPQGFSAHVAAIGIKDDTDDFLVLAAERTSPAAAVFTRSRFVGPSVTLSRANVADGRLRAVVVVSKNANVATGEQGARDAAELADGVAAALGCAAVGRARRLHRCDRAALSDGPGAQAPRDADPPLRDRPRPSRPPPP